MKTFVYEAAREVIAKVTVPGEVFNSLGGTWDKGIAPFLNEHPEYKDCHYENTWNKGNVEYTFYSIGNIAIVEA